MDNSFRFVKKGDLLYWESARLKQLDSLIHAFCGRQGGVSAGPYATLNVSAREGDKKENIQKNWGIIAHAFDLSPAQFLVVQQIHQDGILIIDSPDFPLATGQPLQYDAIVTSQPGLALCIKTADCIPLFLADPVKRVIAAVHAGWRGTGLNIAGKAVDSLRDRFSSCPEDIVAIAGPAIGPCCYEVDRPVFEAMHTFDDANLLLRPSEKKDRWMLDLAGVNKVQLLRSGVMPENIFTSGLCTACQTDLFYSHRAEKGYTGRQANFIMLRGPD